MKFLTVFYRKQEYHYAILAILFIILPVFLQAQITIGNASNDEIDYLNPKRYEIGGITVSGVQYLDNNVLILLSGLSVGQRVTIPGEDIKNAIEKLWQQGLFENIKVSATKIEGEIIFLNLDLKERPRLSKFSFSGVKKAEVDKIRDEIKLTRGDVVTENLLMRTTNSIKKYFIEKGYLNVEVAIEQQKDTTLQNTIALKIDIHKRGKVRIKTIEFEGNKALSDIQLKNALKTTKEKGAFRPFSVMDWIVLNTYKLFIGKSFNWYYNGLVISANQHLKFRVFKPSKFIEDEYSTDKNKIIEKYNELGYRDARILKDSVFRNNDNSIGIRFQLYEGHRYYFRNITWVGNTKYSSEYLNQVLHIKKGDIYNQKQMEESLMASMSGFDVYSLYMDDGYLFFQVNPVEINVENDSIDIEMRMYEGKQATVNKVSISGNTRTNDHVVIRELRTRPGQLFSRSDLIRSRNDLAALSYFNQEKIIPDVQPNPADGTVDIEYKVEEASSDQVELQGGWGYGRIVGTFGLKFNNFSLPNFLKFDLSKWRPIPSGNGQKLNLRVQSYGKGYYSYSISFIEPWLGGKKPNSLSLSYYHSLYSNGYSKSSKNYAAFRIDSYSVGLGKRLRWPDDFFILSQSINLQMYHLDNYSNIFSFGSGNGKFNNYNYEIVLSRRSIDAPIYTRYGSEVSLDVELTPPYSLFNDKDYTTMNQDDKYKWIEYHKWRFTGNFYKQIIGDLVLNTRIKYGFLGCYNQDIGITPFERFYLGGDGLSGYNQLDGREIIGFRGYSNESMTPNYFFNKNTGGTIFNKNTIELRFPLSLNPSSTIYALAFLEAGNAWMNFKEFNPFNIKKSAGVGIRVFLPMFGMLGLDWGYGFDDIPGIPSASKGQFHFSINQSID
ncbi:MAG: BamA/TamA family outer membrane protein [Lentimicrobiaceae bacterium]|nr:BamA/TamA family outer membrane protein [Lentimicrobiaceae bacterium]